MNSIFLYQSRFIITTLLVLFSQLANAYEYKVEYIADSLKEDAVAVVRNYSAVYTQTDINNATFRVSRVVTILNDRGNNYAHFFGYKDNFTDFRKFEGVIRNGEGKEIKKIKKGDLVESNISDQMATDSYRIYYEVTSPVYPYTVEYTYEQRFKNGIISYPMFLPMSGPRESVEKAEYIIELPLDLDLRYQSTFACNQKEEKTEKQHIYTFSTDAMKAIKSEPLAPTFGEYAPSVRFTPSNFCYDKVCGNMSTFENYGKWVQELVKGRGILPPNILAQIEDLTKDAKSDREKVGLLYKYLQDNTRYVSIQLGIGGFQPILAESTIKNNYGDCKGLSNLMMALLSAVNIPSNYCEIYMGDKKEFNLNYSPISQTNHAVLLVPLPNDSIWLECTSQTLPMGYIHSGIAGHDALVVTENGGVVCRLPEYASNQNLLESTLLMNIAEDGKVDGQMKFVEHIHGFGSYSHTMKSNDRERHVRYINGSLSMARVDIGNIKTSESLGSTPFCTLEANYEADNIVNITGSRMFIPIVPLNKKEYDIFKSNTRVHDIVIVNGFSEVDIITIYLPEGYEIESLPLPISIQNDYGIFSTKVEKQDNNSVVYTQYIDIFTGRHDKSTYQEIKEFYQKIVTTSKNKIVAKKI